MSFFNKIFGESNTKSEHKNFWNDIKNKSRFGIRHIKIK